MPSPSRPVSPAAFFTLTYLLSWIIWIPLALSHFGVGPFHISESVSGGVRLLGVLMPAVSAMLLAAFTGGRSALKDLFKPLKTWRVGWQWWCAAALVYPALLIAAALIYNTAGWQPSLTQAPLSISALLVQVILLSLATLGEEIGWRGMALPALQRGRGPLASSLILGLLWAAWHLPFWLLLDTFTQYGAAYLALNFLFIVPSTLYITWFYNNSRGSLLLPVAFHLVFNIVNVAVFPVTPNLGAYAVFIVLQFAVVGVAFRGMAKARPVLQGT